MATECRIRNGFTLIEILVALAIVAIALTAIVTETGQHVNSTIHMRDRTLAHFVAMNRVTELLTAAQWPAVGVSNGVDEMAGRDWFWNATVSATPDDDIRRLDIEVRVDRNRDNPNASLIAYLPRPAP
jgi:general secretion pathway protein I